MAKLTKRMVEAFKVPAGSKEAFLWDDELPCFGLRVQATGGRAFLIQYRVGRRTRRLSLGPFGRLTIDEARKKARELLVAVEKGADPSAARAESRTAPTVAELADRYLEQHANVKKKPRSASEDRRMFKSYVAKRIGGLKVADVKRSDIEAIHYALRDKPTQANRVLALLSKMLNLAEKWGYRPDGSNPCRHVDRYRENKRERYLTADELKKLGEALRDIEEERVVWPTVVPLVRLLLFTGARLDEIRTAKWDHVDLDAGLLRLPDSKTGAKAIELSPAAIEVLQGIEPKPGNPFIIYGKVPGQPLVNVKKPWFDILKRAGLATEDEDGKRSREIRIHDLRHSFASFAVSGGYSLAMIGSLLGHTQAATTNKYAHLHRSPRAAAAARVSGDIAALMAPKPASDKVVNLRSGTD